MTLSKRINLIRKVSIILFICSFFSIIGSLWLQNTIVEFKFDKNISQKEFKILEKYVNKITCSNNVDVCRKDAYLGFFEYSSRLGDCYKNKFEKLYVVDEKVFKERFKLFIDNDYTKQLKAEFVNKEIEIHLNLSSIKNESCIKNSKHYYFYKIFPFYYETLYNLKNSPKTKLGALEVINPFINGETSISNIVKRFPINYVFKTFLFISVIFMYLYWKNYKFLFSKILNIKKSVFFYFGIASAIFLFFHVLFLGIDLDNKLFKILRKLIIVFFILSEILAQLFLSIQLFKNKNNLSIYCNTFIINIKITFVILIFIISTIVISLLLIYDLSSKVDYILEWNYFAVLLFYYFFSFLMWKKRTN